MFFGGTGRTFSLEVASFALTCEFSEAPKALRARFFARLQVSRFCAQTCSSEPPQDAWSLDFRVRDGCFSRFFQATSDQRAKRPTSKKHCKNQYETHFGASAHCPKIDQKSICKPFRLRLATRTALRASWEVSRSLLDSSWPLLARPERPQIGFGASCGRPKAVPRASGRVPEAAMGTQNGPRSIFR